MIRTELNPPWLVPQDGVDLLNQGFGDQWNRRSFQWYLRREFNGRCTDVGVRTDGQRLLAIASYCYRTLIDGAGNTTEVCIMGAAATLPAERGRGHYRDLVQTGLSLCRERSCAALLGFATADNSSCLGFTRLGAYTIPTYYVSSPRGDRRHARERQRPLRAVPAARAARALQMMGHGEFAAAAGGRTAGIRFHYARATDWHDQFVRRSHPVRALQAAHDCVALIEQVGDTDRLQWLGAPPRQRGTYLAALAAASAALNRRFFMFTMDPLLAQSACRLGLRARRGVLLVLPIDCDRVPLPSDDATAWDVQSGDRM